MQLNQIAVSTGVLSTASPSGTLITAIDQIPITTTSGSNFTLALSWANDNSNSSGVTSCSAVGEPGPSSCSYVRGIQNSHERELYKKHKVSFFPAFYDYIMAPSAASGAITNVTNPLISSTAVWTTNGSVERKIKKWVTVNNANQAGISDNTGPLYFGPMYALDVNAEPGTSANSIPLFDVRLTYSVSFKRLRGVA